MKIFFLAKHHLLLKIIKSSNDSNSWKIIKNEERNEKGQKQFFVLILIQNQFF